MVCGTITVGDAMIASIRYVRVQIARLRKYDLSTQYHTTLWWMENIIAKNVATLLAKSAVQSDQGRPKSTGSRLTYVPIVAIQRLSLQQWQTCKNRHVDDVHCAVGEVCVHVETNEIGLVILFCNVCVIPIVCDILCRYPVAFISCM